MADQTEKKMENDMESRAIWGFIQGYIGERKKKMEATGLFRV